MIAVPLLAQKNSRRGLALILASVLAGSVSALMVKGLVEHYSIWQITFFRFSFALPVVILATRQTASFSSLKTTKFGGHLLRAFTGVASISLTYYSYHFLPLAEAVVVSNCAPIFAVGFSCLVLGEPTGRWRWIAVLVGLIGVLVITQPGFGAVSLTGMLTGLGGAALTGATIVNLRVLGRTESSTTTVFYFFLLAVIMTGAVLPFIWQEPSWKEMALFGAVGILAAVYNLAQTRAYQYASASVLTPFSYLGVLFAALFGFVLWGEIPTWSMVAGGALIIASGLVILWEEGKKRGVND